MSRNVTNVLIVVFLIAGVGQIGPRLNQVLHPDVAAQCLNGEKFTRDFCISYGFRTK